MRIKDFEWSVEGLEIEFQEDNFISYADDEMRSYDLYFEVPAEYAGVEGLTPPFVVVINRDFYLLNKDNEISYIYTDSDYDNDFYYEEHIEAIFEKVREFNRAN